MSGRFYDPNPVYFDTLSNQPVAGGFLQFFDQGTTNPRMTWSDQALTIPNTNPVPLDSSGRANVNIWLSGSYSVRLTDSLGAVIWTRDVNDGSVGNNVFPTLEAGKFLTNDGSVVLWADLIQLPDPTGSDGKMVVASGGGYVLQAQPVAPTSPVVTTDTSVKYIGTSSTILEQWGAGSIPASGTKVASTVITFPTAYLTPPIASVGIARSSGVVAAGFIGCLGWTTSTTQLAINWDLNIANSGSEFNLTSPIPITWRAIGKVAS
ncbi:TPA: hypothetical protein ACKPZV_000238 [Stenotrophomonas maltophilia]